MKAAWSICMVALSAACWMSAPSGHKPGVEQSAIRQNLIYDFAVPVLMYHRVDELTPSESKSPLVRDLTVAPADFEAQIRMLKESGYTFLLASQVEEAVMNKQPLPEKAVAVTLDDGYRDNFDKALPILRKYNVPATIFVVTNSVEKDNRLTWGQILTMKSAGLGFGSHTVHHFDLTTLSEQALDFELRESKAVLEVRLGCQITNIAYPSGKYDDRVRSRAEAAGYLAAWKKGGGPVRPDDDMLMLPRVRVHGRTDLGEFERKFKSGTEQLAMERSIRRRSRES